MSNAWAKVAIENIGLKTGIAGLTAVSIVLSILLVQAQSRDPIVIERECFSKAQRLVGSSQTKEEIDTFLHLALSARFDSEFAESFSLLNGDQIDFRAKEQKDLKSRDIKQFIHVNSIAQDRDSFVIDADRIISVGQVRSALKFPLKGKFAAVTRSKENPYGLELTEVNQIKEAPGEK